MKPSRPRSSCSHPMRRRRAFRRCRAARWRTTSRAAWRRSSRSSSRPSTLRSTSISPPNSCTRGAEPRRTCSGRDRTRGRVLGEGETQELQLDNSGNAFVLLYGNVSCASGSSLIEASLTSSAVHDLHDRIHGQVSRNPPGGLGDGRSGLRDPGQGARGSSSGVRGAGSQRCSAEPRAATIAASRASAKSCVAASAPIL